MNAKRAQELADKSFSNRFFESVKRHPFITLPLYTAAAIGIAYAVTNVSIRSSIPTVLKNGQENLLKEATVSSDSIKNESQTK